MTFIEEYIGRIVVVLTPVFAGLAGWLATWVAQNLPGSPIVDPEALTAIFVSGVGAAVAAVLSWLKGRREYERSEQEFAQFAVREEAFAASEVGRAEISP